MSRYHPRTGATQTWRVVCTDLRETFPPEWEAPMERELCGPTGLYLMDELRIIPPAFNVFMGLELPVISLDINRVTSKFLSIPSEIHFNVFDHLSSIDDKLCLTFASRRLLSTGLRALRSELARTALRGRWAGKRLVNFGSKTAGVDGIPPTIKDEELRGWDSQSLNGNYFFNSGNFFTGNAFNSFAYISAATAGTVLGFVDHRCTIIPGYSSEDRIQAPPECRISFDTLCNCSTHSVPLHKEWIKRRGLEETIPKFMKSIIERALLIKSGDLKLYPSNAKWVVRNLDKHEYFRYSDMFAIAGELETVFGMERITIENAACMILIWLISWSSNNIGLVDEMLESMGEGKPINGSWAGCKIDVAVEGSVEKGIWRDIKDEAFQAVRIAMPTWMRNRDAGRQVSNLLEGY